MDKNIANILRITIYQIRYLDKIPSFAAVNEAVEMSKKNIYKIFKVSKWSFKKLYKNLQK